MRTWVRPFQSPLVVCLALPFTHKLTHENAILKTVEILRTYLVNNHSRATWFGGQVPGHWHDQGSPPSWRRVLLLPQVFRECCSFFLSVGGEHFNFYVGEYYICR